MLLTKVENPEQFGVAELKENKVVRVVEKPKIPETDLALIGVYFFDKSIHEAIDNINHQPGELEITDAIQWLIDNQYNIEAAIIDG